MLETGDACRKRRSPKVLCANSEVQQSTRMRKRYAFAACAIRTETIFSLRLVCRWMLLYRGFSRSWLVGVGWSGLAGCSYVSSPPGGASVVGSLSYVQLYLVAAEATPVGAGVGFSATYSLCCRGFAQQRRFFVRRSAFDFAALLAILNVEYVFLFSRMALLLILKVEFKSLWLCFV